MTGPVTALHSIVGFAWVLRGAGVTAGPDRVQSMVAGLAELGPAQVTDLYWAGRCTLCSSPEDLPKYDLAFALWFGGELPGSQHAVESVRREENGPAVTGAGSSQQASAGEARVVSASDRELLRHKDVAEMDDRERDEIRAMLAAFPPLPPVRSARRLSPAARGRPDPQRTVRAMMRHGGDPARMLYRASSIRPRRIVLLLDISGSMSGYADMLLRYAYACVHQRPGTEVFTLGTRLTRITRELAAPQPDTAMATVAGVIADWSGGTRLGTGIKDFLDRHGENGLARGALVVVASDGWERGNAALLGGQMRRLRRLARRVVWLHPYLERPGFQPRTAGLAAALPSVDNLVAGHSLAALAELSRLLSNASQEFRPVRPRQRHSPTRSR